MSVPYLLPEIVAEMRAYSLIFGNIRYLNFAELSYLITLDNPEMIKRFFNEYGKNLPAQKNVLILQDLRNMFIRQFGPSKYPSVFLYSSSKKLILYSDEDTHLEHFLKLINGDGNE